MLSVGYIVQLPLVSDRGRRKRCSSWQVVVVFLGRKTLECTLYIGAHHQQRQENRCLSWSCERIRFQHDDVLLSYRCFHQNLNCCRHHLTDSVSYSLSTCLEWVMTSLKERFCVLHRLSNEQTASQGVDNKTQWKALSRKGTLFGLFSGFQNNLPFFFLLVFCTMHSREAWDSQASWWELGD